MIPFHQAKAEAVEAFEREYFLEALSLAGGNVTRMARMIGINRTWFYRRLAQLGLMSALANRTTNYGRRGKWERV